MVDRCHERESEGHQGRDVVGEDLVVVNDVEVVPPPGQQPSNPPAERAGLREARSAHGRELENVRDVAELAQLGDPKRVGLSVQVQARNLGQEHTIVKLGVGLARKHLDAVAESDELPREVTHIDALASAVGLAAITE